MIRWSYLLPRVLVVLVLLTGAHYGIPLVLRWGVTRAIETATRRHADVQQAWGSLVRGEVRIGGIQIARSAASDRNLLQCDSATLALNLNALAHQQFVIDDAQIRGIRLDRPRHFDATGSTRISIPTPNMNELACQGEAVSREWMEHATKLLQRRVEEEFQSLQTARQLAQRWPQDYRQLQQQIRECHQQALQLYQALTAIPSASPSGATLAHLQQRSQKVVHLRQQISQLQAQVLQVAQQIERDHASIAAAFESDRENLRQKMTLARLDEKQLNSYLLNSEIQLWWTRLQPWLEFVQWLNDSPDINQLDQRGSLVRFDTDGPQPRFLIRSATLDGQLFLAGHQVDFLGQAHNWAIAADRQSPHEADPARLHLITRGPFVARLDAELDCVKGVPRRQVAVQCDSLPLAARRWGHERGWIVAVAPGATHLRGRLTLTGTALDGRIQLVQNEIQLSVTSNASGKQDALWQQLAQAARGIEQFQLSAQLTGTVATPQWEIQSNLGSQLQEQFQTAVEQLVRQHTERLLTEAEGRLQTQLQQWKQQLPVPPDQLQQQLAATEQLLSTLAQPVASRFSGLGRVLRRF